MRSKVEAEYERLEAWAFQKKLSRQSGHQGR